jgi:hypothetical protein
MRDAVNTIDEFERQGNQNGKDPETQVEIVMTLNHGYTLRLMLTLNHSRPSYKPSPDVAQAA